MEICFVVIQYILIYMVRKMIMMIMSRVMRTARMISRVTVTVRVRVNV